MSVVPEPQRVAISWSSGKDSAWTVHMLRQTSGVELAGLITTFNSSANRVAMHAVRRILVEAQAARLGLPLWAVDLPWPCSDSVYESLMSDVCRRVLRSDITAVAFGDLFLEDIRSYRERQLEPSGLKPLFPVWKIPTRQLAEEMIGAGLRAKVTCIDPTRIDRAFAGKEFDMNFLNSLPEYCDPCGENGEFHTFVYDGPFFSSAINVITGEIVERDGFVFADVLPV